MTDYVDVTEEALAMNCEDEIRIIAFIPSKTADVTNPAFDGYYVYRTGLTGFYDDPDYCKARFRSLAPYKRSLWSKIKDIYQIRKIQFLCLIGRRQPMTIIRDKYVDAVDERIKQEKLFG